MSCRARLVSHPILGAWRGPRASVGAVADRSGAGAPAVQQYINVDYDVTPFSSQTRAKRAGER